MRWSLLCLLFGGCVMSAKVEETVSFGAPGSGYLIGGVPLPKRGEGYALLRPSEATYYGTPGLVGLVKRVSSALAEKHPDGARLVIGDLSARRGGKHRRHATHRTGRDVDIFFPMLARSGRSEGGLPYLHLDRFGGARDARAGERLDLPRAWSLVELLLLDEEAEVQWIFCERGLKARLLRYGVAVGASEEVLFRASWVMQQPTGSSPHDDHFHIRVFCTERERALGCRDGRPHWPWVRLKGDAPTMRMTDEKLVEWLR